jgi:DNA-directed RNA polymerase subunit RPC12/RpoP
MKLKCPQCSKSLPQEETLKFRFCPHCGAEIAAEPRKLDDAYLTLPPDSPPPQADHRPLDLSLETENKITVAGRFNDQTSEPQTMSSRQQPKLKPPDTPPPTRFFHSRSDEKTQTIRSEEEEPPKKDNKKPSPTKKRNTIIAALVILVVIILLLGGLFTF